MGLQGEDAFCAGLSPNAAEIERAANGRFRAAPSASLARVQRLLWAVLFSLAFAYHIATKLGAKSIAFAAFAHATINFRRLSKRSERA